MTCCLPFVSIFHCISGHTFRHLYVHRYWQMKQLRHARCHYKKFRKIERWIDRICENVCHVEVIQLLFMSNWLTIYQSCMPYILIFLNFNAITRRPNELLFTTQCIFIFTHTSTPYQIYMDELKYIIV